MPICKIATNYPLNDDEKNKFADEAAIILSELLEKPLKAIMVMINTNYMRMNQSNDTVCFGEFRYVKSYADEAERSQFLKQLSDKMFALIQKYTKAEPHRVYMQFTHMKRDDAWKYTE